MDVAELRALITKTGEYSDAELRGLTVENAHAYLDRLALGDARFRYELVVSPEQAPKPAPASWFSIQNGPTLINAYPRDVQALRDDPMVVQVRLKDTGVEKMQEFLKTGRATNFTKLLKGEIPGLPRLGYPIVDVRDLADLQVRAITAPQAAGQRYIGSGPFVSMSEIANVLRQRLGDKAKKVPTRKLPDWIVRLVGLFDSEVRGQLFELGKVRWPSNAKAENALGWSSRSWEDTVVDTATSLEAVGVLRESSKSSIVRVPRGSTA